MMGMMDRNKGGKFSHLKQNKKDQQISYSVWGKESKEKKKKRQLHNRKKRTERANQAFLFRRTSGHFMKTQGNKQKIENT